VLFDANGKRFALPLVVAISEIGVRTQRMRPDIATALVGAAMLSVLLVSNTRRCAAEQVCRSFSNADQVNHSPQKPELEKNCFSTPHPPMKPTSVLLLTANYPHHHGSATRAGSVAVASREQAKGKSSGISRFSEQLKGTF
jgi:hypothetical protein